MPLIDKELKARLDKIDQIRDELKKAEKSATKDIMSLLKDLMKSNPMLVGLRWRQYTPHFNDGDVCEFGIDGPEFKFSEDVVPAKDSNDDEEDEYGSDDGWLDEWTVDDEFFNKKADILNHKQIMALRKTVKDAQTVFGKLTFMDTQLQAMFGDGFEITVTADGVETEEYSHD